VVNISTIFDRHFFVRRDILECYALSGVEVAISADIWTNVLVYQ